MGSTPNSQPVRSVCVCAGLGSAPAAPALPLLTSSPGVLTVSGRLVRAAGTTTYQLALRNDSAGPLDGFMLQTNKSTFGITPAVQVLPVAPIAPGATATCSLPMAFDAAKVAGGPVGTQLQVALKTGQQGVVYWTDNVPLAAVTDEQGTMEVGHDHDHDQPGAITITQSGWLKSSPYQPPHA